VAHRIAVQMASHNDAAFIGPSLDSVLAQRCEPFELIVSDDASTDDTVAIAEGRASAYRGPHAVRIIRQAHNLGPAFHGAERYENQSQAPILVIATADDLHAPGRVAALVGALDATGADLVCSNAAWISEQGAFLRPHVQGRATGPVTLDEILTAGWSRSTLGATFAFRRALWTDTGGFRDNLIPNGIDLFLPLRAALSGGCHFIGDPLLLWRQHSRQLKRAVTDESAGKSVAGEAHRILLLAVRLQHIRELARDPRPGVRQRIPALHAEVLKEAVTWVAHRRRNLTDGHRVQWVRLHGLLEQRREVVDDARTLAVDAASESVAQVADAVLAGRGGARKPLVQQLMNRLVNLCWKRRELYRSHLRPVWVVADKARPPS